MEEMIEHCIEGITKRVEFVHSGGGSQVSKNKPVSMFIQHIVEAAGSEVVELDQMIAKGAFSYGRENQDSEIPFHTHTDVVELISCLRRDFHKIFPSSMVEVMELLNKLADSHPSIFVNGKVEDADLENLKIDDRVALWIFAHQNENEFDYDYSLASALVKIPLRYGHIYEIRVNASIKEARIVDPGNQFAKTNLKRIFVKSDKIVDKSNGDDDYTVASPDEMNIIMNGTFYFEAQCGRIRIVMCHG